MTLALRRTATVASAAQSAASAAGLVTGSAGPIPAAAAGSRVGPGRDRLSMKLLDGISVSGKSTGSTLTLLVCAPARIRNYWHSRPNGISHN